jgi:hypothetical protein
MFWQDFPKHKTVTTYFNLFFLNIYYLLTFEKLKKKFDHWKFETKKYRQICTNHVSEQKLSTQVLLEGTGGSNVVQLTYIQLVLISLYCTVTYLHMFWQDFPKQMVIFMT